MKRDTFGFITLSLEITLAARSAWYTKLNLFEKEFKHNQKFADIVSKCTLCSIGVANAAKPTEEEMRYRREIDANHARRAAPLYARILRIIKWCENENARILAAMNQEQAIAALVENRDSRSLAWFEALPLGVSMQAAADKTGKSFCFSRWSSNVLETIWFWPLKSPHKSRLVAKRI